MRGKLPAGKGQFIHYLYRLVIFYGGVDALVVALIEAGYQWVAPKAQQGIWAFTGSKQGNWTQQELLIQFAESCRKHGLAFHIWGWIFLYAGGRSTVNRESAKTIELCKKLQPLSYIVNKEVKSDIDENHLADSYMRQVKRELAIPFGLSSFKFPKSHREIPWKGFGDHVEYWAPQVYWQKNDLPNGSILELHKSIEQHTAIRDLPLVPAGSCYPDGDWWPTPEQVLLFSFECKALANVIAVNYWTYYYGIYNRPQLGEALYSFVWRARPALSRIIKRAMVYRTRNRIQRANNRRINQLY